MIKQNILKNRFKMNLQYLGATVRDSIIHAGLGYIVGHIAQTSPEKVAIVFAISNIATNALRVFTYYTTSDLTSSKGLKDFHNVNVINSMIIGCVTAAALQRMQLLTGIGAYYLASGSVILNFVQLKL